MEWTAMRGTVTEGDVRTYESIDIGIPSRTLVTIQFYDRDHNLVGVASKTANITQAGLIQGTFTPE